MFFTRLSKVSSFLIFFFSETQDYEKKIPSRQFALVGTWRTQGPLKVLTLCFEINI